jgi:response regulator RpfG family c-di-GMP phosphodiesterase
MSANYGLRFETMESAFVSNEDPSLFVQLAQAYRDAGDFDRALRILRRGIEQHPAHGPGYELLGLTLLERARVAEAAFCFERLIAIDPNNPTALEALEEIARRLREAPLTRFMISDAPPVNAAPLLISPSAPSRPQSMEAPTLWPEGRPEPNGQAEPEPAQAEPIAAEPPVAERAQAEPVAAEPPRAERLAASPQEPTAEAPAPEPPAPEPPAPAPRASEAPAPPPPVIARFEVAAAAEVAEEKAAPESEPELEREVPVEELLWDAEPEPVFNGAPQNGAHVDEVSPAAPRLERPEVTPLDLPEVHLLEVSLLEGPAQPKPVEANSDVGLLNATTVMLADLLVGLVEYRDPFFRGNTSLTRLLATAIARDLKLPEPDVSAIALGAVLRDLGQFSLRDGLNRPGQELPADARRNMERHVETALDMLTGIQLPPITRDTIRYHHERWDGTGYPSALAGESIPLSARIVAVADSFSALISARPHRLPRRVPAALEEIRAASGELYDPRVVDALFRVVNATHWKGPGFSLRHHVLIVDPDETKAMVIATRLCSHGYLAEATTNANAAQDRLEKSNIAALILSSDLPGEDEERLLRRVRETARIATMPIIMTNASVSERVMLLEAGADVCLNRGSSFDELRATLEAFLRREGKAIPNMGSRDGENGWSRLRGDIRDFPLSWLLQALHYDSRTAAIFLVAEGDEGVIYLERGTPRHAQTRLHSGDDAFRALLNWKTGSFSVDPEARTEQLSIRLSLMNLLLDSAREEDRASFFGQIQP